MESTPTDIKGPSEHRSTRISKSLSISNLNTYEGIYIYQMTKQEEVDEEDFLPQTKESLEEDDSNHDSDEMLESEPNEEHFSVEDDDEVDMGYESTFMVPLEMQNYDNPPSLGPID